MKSERRWGPNAFLDGPLISYLVSAERDQLRFEFAWNGLCQLGKMKMIFHPEFSFALL